MKRFAVCGDSGWFHDKQCVPVNLSFFVFAELSYYRGVWSGVVSSVFGPVAEYHYVVFPFDRCVSLANFFYILVEVACKIVETA